MSRVPIVSELLEVANICKDLNALVKEVKNAPIQYQSSVQALTRMHGWFQSLVEEIEARSAAGEREGWSTLHHCSNEITIMRTALKGAQNVLLSGYAAGANRHRFHTLKKRLRWSSNHAKFEKCLRDAREHFNTITALVGVHDMKLFRQQHETLAAIELHLNNKPQTLGYPECGGVPQDHIRLYDGLGRHSFLPIDFWRSPQRLQDCLNGMFSDLPGKRHIEKLHYKIFNISNSHGPQELTEGSWPYLVKSGCSTVLVFVVGTWQMSAINFCPNCNHRNAGDWNSWRRCKCGSSYFVAEAGAVEYEPLDGLWIGEGESVQNSRHSNESKARRATTACARLEEDDTCESAEPDAQGQDIFIPYDAREENNDERYFKWMLMVYDPIFNFVCRNVFCRCILGAVSFSSNAPQIDVLSVQACPRHAKSGVRPNYDAVVRTSNDYNYDPYFDQFGGYKNFQRIARFLNQSNISLAFVDWKKLCPEQPWEDESMFSLISEHLKAVSQYREEVLSKLRCCWSLCMKAKYEKMDPSFVSCVESWMTDEHEELAKLSDLERSDETRRRWAGMSQNLGRLMPFLSKGRLSLEEVDKIRLDKKYVCAWP